MMQLIFKIKPASTRNEPASPNRGESTRFDVRRARGRKAKERGRSPIEIVLSRPKSGSRPRAGEIFKATTENTDNLLFTLDKLLKRNKIKLESLKDVKVEISKETGLTSQRIVKAIVKALRFSLD